MVLGSWIASMTVGGWNMDTDPSRRPRYPRNAQCELLAPANGGTGWDGSKMVSIDVGAQQFHSEASDT